MFKGQDEELIELVADFVARRVRKGMIKDAIRAIAKEAGYPEPCHQTMETIISAAKARIRELAVTNTIDQKGMALRFYEMVIADDDIAIKERLSAQHMINDMLGIGEKYNQERGDEYLDKARRIREAILAMDEVTGEHPNTKVAPAAVRSGAAGLLPQQETVQPSPVGSSLGEDRDSDEEKGTQVDRV